MDAGVRPAPTATLRRAAWSVAVAGSVMMGAAMIYGFAAGEGWSEVARLWEFPWFRVSIVDIYVGLAVIALWIWSRERPVVALAWMVLLVCLGHFATCLYLLRALRHGDRSV